MWGSEQNMDLNRKLLELVLQVYKLLGFVTICTMDSGAVQRPSAGHQCSPTAARRGSAGTSSCPCLCPSLCPLPPVCPFSAPRLCPLPSLCLYPCALWPCSLLSPSALPLCLFPLPFSSASCSLPILSALPSALSFCPFPLSLSSAFPLVPGCWTPLHRC